MPKVMTKTDAPDRFKIHVPVLKAYEDEAGEWWIEGAASGPKKDLQQERMSRACIDSMTQQINSGQLPLRVSHWDDWDGDLGFLRAATVDPVSYEMKIKAWLDKSDQAAQKLWRRLHGDPSKGIQPQKLGLSIGGRLVDGHSETEGGDYVYVLDDISLDHVAVTSSPAYPDAWIARSWLKSIRKAWAPARWRGQLVTADPEEDDDMSKRRRRQRAKDNLDPAAVGGTAKQDPEPGEGEEDSEKADDEIDPDDPEKSDDDADAEDPEKSDDDVDDDDPEKSEDDDEDAAPAKGGPSVETLVTVITDGVMEAVKAATPDLIRKAMSQQPGFWKRSGDLEGEEEVWCRDQEAEQDLVAEEEEGEDDPDAFDDDEESEADDDEDEEKSMPTIDQLKKSNRALRRKNQEIEARLAKLEGKKVPSREERAKSGERRGKGPDADARKGEADRRAKGEEKKIDPRKWVEEIKASDAYMKATPQQRVDLLKRGMIRTLSQSESSAA